MNRRAVIGCGNLNRSDDAAGVRVVQRLRQLVVQTCGALPLDLTLFDAGTAGMEVMFAARGVQDLVIVDACRSGAAPGSIYQVPAHELVNAPPQSYGLHDFRWDHALYAGQRIYGAAFPTAIQVWLMEVENTDLGLTLTPVMADAVETVAQRLLNTWVLLPS